MSHLPSYPIRFFDYEATEADCRRDIPARLARLEAAGMMPEAVLLREDILPGMREWGRYPVIRMERSSERMWGVLA